MRLTEHFAVRILEHDIDPALANKLEDVITPHLKDYVPKLAKNWQHLTDFAEEENIFAYKCAGQYNPKQEHTIKWNDLELDINWGIDNPIISEKDNNGMSFKKYRETDSING